jgi:hypothetical protein
MITLYPPSPSTVPQRIKLHTGAAVFPDRNDFGKVRVPDESEAIELESLGWHRDAASRQAKAATSDLLQKGFHAQLTRTAPGVGTPTIQKSKTPSNAELLKRAAVESSWARRHVR